MRVCRKETKYGDIEKPADAAGDMRWQQKLIYASGHIYNDLCASMWFTLLIVFFQYIIHFQDALAGYLLLWGQVTDAIATPIVGYLCDMTDGFCGYGRRKSWHLLGNNHARVSTQTENTSIPTILSGCYLVACVWCFLAMVDLAVIYLGTLKIYM